MKREPSLNSVGLQRTVGKKLQQFCEQIKLPPDAPPHELVALGMQAAEILKQDKHLLQMLKQLTDGEISFLVINHLPVDHFTCSLPTKGLRPTTKSSWVAEIESIAILFVAGLIPFAFIEEKPELAQTVCRVPGQEGMRGNSGTVRLPFHSDNSIIKEPFRPEFLLLNCLINQANVPTQIALVEEAFAILNPEQQRLLTLPVFRYVSPDSFDSFFHGRKVLSEKTAIISRDDKGRLHGAGNLFAVQTVSICCKEALNAFQEALERVSIAVQARPGTSLLFSNSMCFHARGPISEKLRWLIRFFASRSLTPIRQMTNSDAQTYLFNMLKLVI